MTLEYELGFGIRAEDVGGTQRVIVSVGDYEIGRYLPGTSNEDTALEDVVKLFAVALGALVTRTIDEEQFPIREDDSL